MNYRATIHTMEIEPVLRYPDEVRSWISKAYDANCPCISQLYPGRYGSMPRAIINPHRLHATPDGKYSFTYVGLREHLENMQSVCELLDMEGYIIRRMDVCLDADAPYAQTQKMTRLIALLLGERFSAENRDISTDPLSFEPKTLRLDNTGTYSDGRRREWTLQVEHYNRELVNQIRYTGEPIRNRFELRAKGAQAGYKSSEHSIVTGWIERLEALSVDDINSLCQRLNEALVEECGRYTALTGSTGTNVNAYVRMHLGDIYTRRQMVSLFDMLGFQDPEQHTKDFIKRFGAPFERFRNRQIFDEISGMKAALMGFIGDE